MLYINMTKNENDLLLNYSINNQNIHYMQLVYIYIYIYTHNTYMCIFLFISLHIVCRLI